jgi:hypothetical protein
MFSGTFIDPKRKTITEYFILLVDKVFEKDQYMEGQHRIRQRFSFSEAQKLASDIKNSNEAIKYGIEILS